jgi:hypothetical protein
MVTTTSKRMNDGTSGNLLVDNNEMTYMLIIAVKELNQELEEFKNNWQLISSKFLFQCHNRIFFSSCI